jgi:5-methylthioribose kinase
LARLTQAIVFSAYKVKANKRETTKELNVLQKLYNEQEIQTEMIKLKEKHEARMAALAAKGAAKAQRQADKAAGGEPLQKKAKP